MGAAVVAVVCCAIALVVVLMSVAQNRHEKRVKELSEWAEQRGWRYDEERADLVDHFVGKPFVKQASGPKAQHVLSGTHRGRRVLGYEYRYTTSSYNGTTTTSTTHIFRIVAVAVPNSTPVLEVREEHLGHKLLEIVGVHDLQLGHSLFDETFKIEADDDDFARSVLAPEVMEWILDEPVGRRVPFRFTGDHLLTWESIGLDPGVAVETADFLIDLLERIPERAWENPRQR